MTLSPGAYDSLSNAEYHSGPGTSKSGLDIIHRSPMHFAFAKSAANDNAPTAAQSFGSAFHALVLEPQVFVREYCLSLRREDEPDAIDERETLVAMIQELNSSRLPLLPTSGSKADLIARINEAAREQGPNGHALALPDLESMKGDQLKAIIIGLNTERTGLLPISGTRHELAEILRANGKPVRLWSDVMARWMEVNGHRTVLSAADWDALHRMRDAVMEHPAASKLLSAPGKAERSYYWIDQETGELLRCRPDYDRDDGIIVDLKSTHDASPEEFARSVANWRYHVQHPFYMDGRDEAIRQAGLNRAKSKAFVFIAVEKTPPYAVGVYMLDDKTGYRDDAGNYVPTPGAMSSVDVGRAEYRADLRTLAECRRTNVWRGYGDTIQSISLPAWRMPRVIA